MLLVLFFVGVDIAIITFDLPQTKAGLSESNCTNFPRTLECTLCNVLLHPLLPPSKLHFIL